MITHRGEIVEEIERRRIELSLGLLRIYNYYRSFVGLALLVAVNQQLFSTRLGELNQDLFWWYCLLYTAINIVSTIVFQLTPRKWFDRGHTSLGLVLFDVFSLTLLAYTSGGIASGFAPLILITVVTGAILVTGRLATFVAAAATIALLYQEFYLAFSQPEGLFDFFQAGIFGIIYFTASISVQHLSNRLRQNDIRALTQAAELADLERLNKLIIQRMRTGIIVVDSDNHVRMHNQSALALIGAKSNDGLMSLPERLAQHLAAWRVDTSVRSAPFQVGARTPEIRVNFSALRTTDPSGDVTIFLEDTGEIQQQAQQLKLAELGRLSASIAHEVRNPLGAISHAAQLLKESEELTSADKRLTEIIINHCERMNGVVENVLDMSRRHSPQPSRINLYQHLQEFVSQFKQASPEAQVEISVSPEDTEVRIDTLQFNQALTNLVENGIRYSVENSAGHRVLLEAGMDPSSDRPFLNVIDYGQGVSPELHDRLFQPFATTAVNGTGLGLYISRELVESNNAQISYSQHEEGGSCFRILFAHPGRITS